MEVVEGFKRYSKKYIDSSGFGYKLNRKMSGDVLFLRCCENFCRGSGTYKEKENLFQPNIKHTHEPNADKILVWRFLQRLKHRVEVEDGSLYSIYKEERQKYQETYLPPFSRLKSTLKKRRQNAKKIYYINESDQMFGKTFTDSSLSSASITVEVLPKKQLSDHNEPLVYDAFPLEFPHSSSQTVGIHHESDNRAQNTVTCALNSQWEHVKGDGLNKTPGISCDSSIVKVVEVIEGGKCPPLFVDEVGYVYQKKQQEDGSSMLRCFKANCSAEAKFFPDKQILQMASHHQHESSSIHLKKLKFLQKIGERSETESRTLLEIYTEEAANDVGFCLPTYVKTKSLLKKQVSSSLKESENVCERNKPIKSSILEPKLLMTHYIDKKGMDILEGPRRFSKLYIDQRNFCYIINKKQTNGSLSLRCHEKGCRGSGRYDPKEGVFNKIRKHAHYANPNLVNQFRFLHRCKLRAEKENTSFKTIYVEEASRCRGVTLPSFRTLSNTLHKRRLSSKTSETKNEGVKQPETKPFCLQSRVENEQSEGTLSIVESSETDDVNVMGTNSLPATEVKISSCNEFHDEEEINTKIEIVEGPRRFSKMFIDGQSFVYKADKESRNGEIFLRCYVKGCSGTGVYSPSEEVFRKRRGHSHSPSFDMVNKCRLMNNLKRRAENETTSLKSIYEEEIAKYPNVDLPSVKRILSTLHKRRKSHSSQESKSLMKVAQKLKSGLCKGPRGNLFHRYLNIEDSEALLFVSSGSMLKSLSEIETFHLDTLNSPLEDASHIIVMYASFKYHLLPFVYVLLSEGTQIAYRGVFEYIKKEMADFQPQILSSNFELDVTSAFQKVFPKCQITRCCWYYYSEAIWKSLSSFELAEIFFSDNEVRRFLLKVMSLVLLPPTWLANGLQCLRREGNSFQSEETKAALGKLLDYVKEEWLNKFGETMSVFRSDKALNMEVQRIRTLFYKRFGFKPLSCIKFSEKLLQFDSVIVSQFDRLSVGQSVHPGLSRKVADMNKLLKAAYLKLEFNLNSIGEFLSTASTMCPSNFHFGDEIEENTTTLLQNDPSDIPNSLEFCEIEVSPKNFYPEEKFSAK